ncbi:MAG: hydrogenase maturation protease [Nitrospirae bacterium]|nr:hydrogenase maturation protease [Nitrospirota bacterium]
MNTLEALEAREALIEAHTVVIGLGNPILSDDGVGIRAARLIKERLNGRADVRVSEIYAGGIRLIDEMAGFDRALIIDAIQTDKRNAEEALEALEAREALPGSIYKLKVDDLPNSRNTGSTHDMTLPLALEMGKMLGMKLPDEIDIWAIEAKDVNTFGEVLSDEVEKSLHIVVENVLGCL